MVAKKTTVKRKRVSFEYNAEPGLQVFVAGSFNSWDEKAKQLVDANGTGEYKAVAMIAQGSYEYKFKVNGQWCIDPSNPNISKNVHGTLNNVLVVE